MNDDERIKELIAIGASVGAHCQPCLEYHIAKARELGVSEEDIQAAIEIGFMVMEGADSAMRKYAGEIVKKDTSL
jgi:AhpD family alkylhydroperoxidase